MSTKIEIPRKTSLVTETARIVRRNIYQGVWSDFLPGERHLSEELHVSRPTLRTALDLLEKEGLLEVTHGKRRRILEVKPPRSTLRRKTIGLITNLPFSEITQITNHVIMEMRYHLQQNGFNTQIFIPPSGVFRYQKRKLENFLRDHEISCSVLVLASREQQEWMASRNIPTLVLGSCYEGTDLPSLDTDHFAVCRHAVGHLLARGHRKLALFRNDNRIAGDRASQEGFLQGIEQSRHKNTSGIVIRHKGTPEDVAVRLNRLLDSEDRPSGILTSRPQETFMVFTQLLKRGMDVPGDISLIARDRDNYFQYLTPKITHYATPRELFSQRLIRLTVQLVQNGVLSTKQHLLFPDFVEGESVKDA